MKKILAAALAAMMLLSATACGDNSTETTTGNAETTTGAVVETTTGNTEETTTGSNTEIPAGPAVIAPEADKKDTLGYLFYEKLVEVKTANPAATSEDIIQAIVESSLVAALPLSNMVMPVEPGTVHSGIYAYDEETDSIPTFDGYVSGTTVYPMMMGDPVILYVFDLAEDANVETFVKKIRNNVNLNWTVCNPGEMSAVGACGNSVLFVICNKEIPARVSGIADIKEPANLSASTESIWEAFKTAMAEQTAPSVGAEDVANALAAAGVAGEVAPVMETITDDVFVYDIESWNAATITDGDKVVYIFGLEYGVDIAYWMESYMTESVVCGSYNETVIAMVNFG